MNGFRRFTCGRCHKLAPMIGSSLRHVLGARRRVCSKCGLKAAKGKR
jgi:ribosomal protein S27AE